MDLYVREQPGAADHATLLLLHGLGANGAVWNPLVRALEGRWPGRILMPDLRGHGKSPAAAGYALGRHAADVAGLLAEGERVVIAGHSMGGAIAVALASGWFSVDVRQVLGLSIKPDFTPGECAAARDFAAKPRRYFETREEAIERFLRTSGLAGIVDPAADVVTDGIRSGANGYTLAADPRTVLVAGPPLGPMLRAAIAPVRLATGARDDIATAAALRACADDVEVIADAGHNVHAEQPGVVAELMLQTFLAGNPR
jgi:pimeloyl-ACP methyl ester carboxylesterase